MHVNNILECFVLSCCFGEIRDTSTKCVHLHVKFVRRSIVLKKGYRAVAVAGGGSIFNYLSNVGQY